MFRVANRACRNGPIVKELKLAYHFNSSLARRKSGQNEFSRELEEGMIRHAERAGDKKGRGVRVCFNFRVVLIMSGDSEGL